MNPIFGIDVSKWQGIFNFAKAKSEGVKFAILRAGYTGSLDGISKVKDSKFELFYKNAKANDILVGAYWYSRATTYEAGKKEAEYMYENCLKGKQFEYPIYIDIEDTKYQIKAGKKSVTEAIKGFCEYLEPKGYYVGIYANSNWFKNYIDTDSLKRYDKWIANWGKSKPTSPEAGMWQFGGETNKIRSNKIAGVTCDQNYAYKDYPGIMIQKGINGYKKIEETSKLDTIPPISSSDTANSSQKPIVDINPSPSLKVGDKVQIIDFGNSQASGKGKVAGGKGYKRYITKIYNGQAFPYQVGNKGKTDSKNTTGFYKEKSLKKV